MAAELAVGLRDIEEARQRIEPWVHKTPVLHSEQLDRLCGGEVFFKAENLQKTGVFKARGACNAVFSLSDRECAAGVATHSSGNHGAALARAARLRELACHVVMPSNASRVKKDAVIAYGAEVIECELTFPMIQASVDTILTVPDEQIIKAMRAQWTRMKTVVEPSGAVSFAALLEHPERFAGRRVACILSGGNVDLDRLPW